MYDETSIHRLAKEAEAEYSRLVDSSSVAGKCDLSRLKNVRFTLDHSAIYSDRMQVPSVRRYPDLKAKPYWEMSDFPPECVAILKKFEKNSQLLLNEYHAGIKAINDNSIPGVTKYFGASEKWRHYDLVRQNGSLAPHIPLLFPEYAKILQELSSLSFLRRVFFAIMEPGVHLEALRVGGIERGWEEGKCLFFDDTFVHSAWNNCSSRKVVLLMRIFHPDLSRDERSAILETDRRFIISPVGKKVKQYLENSSNRNFLKK